MAISLELPHQCFCMCWVYFKYPLHGGREREGQPACQMCISELMCIILCMFYAREKEEKSFRILSASTTPLKRQQIKTCMRKSGTDAQICSICSGSGRINSEAPVSYLCWACSVPVQGKKNYSPPAPEGSPTLPAWL